MRRLLLVPLVLLAAGCGASAGVDADEVAAKTGAASARFEMDMSLKTQEAALSAKEREELAYLNFSATGAIAEHGRIYAFTYVYPASALGLERSGDVTFDAIMDSQTGDVYFKYPRDLGIELPAGKEWIHMQDDELEGLGQSPAEMVDYLYAAGELERAGEERVRGVPVVKYAASIDLERAAAELDAEQDVKDTIEELADAGVEEIPLDVWIDEEGYVRRLEMNWEMPAETGAPAGTRLELTMELWDFGTDVGVRLPAEATVVDEKDLEG